MYFEKTCCLESYLNSKNPKSLDLLLYFLKIPSYLFQELAFYSYLRSLGLQVTLSLICFL